MTVTRRPTDPFGNPRGTQPSTNQWAGTKGFVGGSKDDTTGLTNLGARQYDPVHGRFISPDPILDPANPQQWNGYAYSNNDPINASDPSGLFLGFNCKTCDNIVNKVKDVASGAWHETVQTYNELAEGTARLLGDDKMADNFRYQRENPNSPLNLTTIVSEIGGPLDGPHSKWYQLGRWFAKTFGPFLPLPTPGGLAGSAAIHGGEAIAKRPGAVKNIVSKLVSKIRPKSGPCSFAATTPVLMADGSTREIAEIKPGDQVEAGDPQTGETSGHAVTATWKHDDDDLVDVIVQSGDSEEVIHTTFGHSFWDATTQKWTPAGSLQSGHSLKTESGQDANVVSVREAAGQQVMYNLTVEDLHTYYVLAGNAPVLVHNSNCELRALHSKLPERVDGGQTSGIAMDSHGNTSSIMTSGKGTYRNLIDRANSRLGQWGFRSPAARASDVEQKFAASMLNPDGSTRITSADLVINHAQGPCDEPLGCDMVLPYILNKGQTLTVHFVDGSGVWNSHVYQGLADFG
ncbi:polymorphic toxin-type HINT domain-containing protein [Kitasatospora sp. NPDC057542]|uniref:polymorphic toxin-type HINT domain-containing protein n=1 Tax=Streptomycetaceae TaxID=2062 RepID=UPI001CCE971B|nr:polymorphic toxin-type HINT domain-containing protein [Streptomyces sp. LS1784]